MSIDTSPLYPEVVKILKVPRTEVVRDYAAVIHTEQVDINAVALKTIDVQADYVSAIGHYIYIEVLIGLGKYTKYINDYLNNLELTILIKGTTDIISKKYKFIPITNYTPSPEGTGLENMSETFLDTEYIVVLKGQLVERNIEAIRNMTIGGVFSHTNVTDFLKSVYKHYSDNILIETTKVVDIINIEPSDNTRTYDHITIPDGTKLTALPDMLQRKLGIYNSGLGTYIQDYTKGKTLFIYPLYNWKRRSNNPSLIIYGLEDNHLSSTDNTYRYDGNTLHILASGDREIYDTGEQEHMRSGAGIRVYENSSIMTKPVELTDNGPRAKRESLNYESIYKDRTDNNNYAAIKNDKNLFEAYTSINMHNGKLFNVTWLFSEPTLLYPGMSVRFIFVNKDDKVVHKSGTLLGYHSLYSKPFIPNTSLNIFLEN